jgi:hypothetical protein
MLMRLRHPHCRIGRILICDVEGSDESYQKWTARTFGGPCVPETTCVERTT